MIEFIALVVMISSALGIGVLVVKKIPLLVELPERPLFNSSQKSFSVNTGEVLPERIPKRFFLRRLFFKNRTPKIKSAKRMLGLEETLEENYLEDLEEDKYWDEIKKAVKKS